MEVGVGVGEDSFRSGVGVGDGLGEGDGGGLGAGKGEGEGAGFVSFMTNPLENSSSRDISSRSGSLCAAAGEVNSMATEISNTNTGTRAPQRPWF